MGMFDDNTTTSTFKFNIEILEQLLDNGSLYGNIYNNESYEDHDPNIIDVDYKEIKEENDV